MDIRHKHRRELRESERHTVQLHLLQSRLHSDERGNYPVLLTANGTVVSVPSGNFAQNVPAHYAPHITHARDTRVSEVPNELLELPEAKTLPDKVFYEQVVNDVPQGHTLLGVGTEGVETREFPVLDTCWICGGSKTGKTNTVALKVEEAYNQGHWFIVIDPHKFKADSLYNSIKGYSQRFLLPVAQTHEEIMYALTYFLNEAKKRRDGGACEIDIDLIVDEVGSLTGDKGKTEEQQELYRLLYNIARMCGQELRGFGMHGMFISQNAIGLAWLRSFAMTIIVHKLLMENERKVATNNNMSIVRDMDNWPRGRVLVYGLDIPEGQLLLQMALFRGRVVDSQPSQREQIGYPMFRQNAPERNSETVTVSMDETPLQANSEPNTYTAFPASVIGADTSVKMSKVSEETKRTIKRMAAAGNIPLREIAKYVGLSGEKYGLFREVCTELGISAKKEG